MKTHEIKQAEKFVDQFSPGSKLGKNTKLLEDGETLQARIGDDIRVQFQIIDGKKSILSIFKKENHISHR